MTRESLKTTIRWLLAIGLFVFAVRKILPMRDLEADADPTPLVIAALASLLGAALIWADVFRLATLPLTALIDALIFPRTKLSRPVLNLKLPAHYLNQGRYEEALAEYRIILKHHPDEAEAYEKAIWLEASIFHRPAAAEKLLRRAARRGIELDERLGMMIRNARYERFPSEVHE